MPGNESLWHLPDSQWNSFTLEVVALSCRSEVPNLGNLKTCGFQVPELPSQNSRSWSAYIWNLPSGARCCFKLMHLHLQKTFLQKPHEWVQKSTLAQGFLTTRIKAEDHAFFGSKVVPQRQPLQQMELRYLYRVKLCSGSSYNLMLYKTGGEEEKVKDLMGKKRTVQVTPTVDFKPA